MVYLFSKPIRQLMAEMSYTRRVQKLQPIWVLGSRVC